MNTITTRMWNNIGNATGEWVRAVAYNRTAPTQTAEIATRNPNRRHTITKNDFAEATRTWALDCLAAPTDNTPAEKFATDYLAGNYDALTLDLTITDAITRYALAIRS